MHKYNLIKKTVLIPLVLLISLIVLSGCVFSGKTLTEGNNGQSLNLKVNEQLKVKLESNITTGFKWNLSKETDTSIVSLITSNYVQTSTNKSVGAGGYETFDFMAKSKGNTVIILTYNKPWEEGVEQLKTFRISISVE